MRRVILLGIIVTVGVWLAAPPVAWGDDAIWAVCTSGGQSAPCDTTAWYQAPVSVIWSATGEGTTSGPTSVSPCSLGVQYIYGADAVTNLSCAAMWSDGTYKGDGFALHVEASSPTVKATPSRPPDSNGWYNHPLSVTFQGSNSFSGIASCTPAATYAGPANSAATLAGTCTDNAGKTVPAIFTFAYDTTPPSLTATATTGDRTVDLNWQAGGDIAPITEIAVVRSPGPAGAAGDPVYSGMSSGYQDSNVSDGVTYTYTVTAYDAAGNASTQTITATPEASLLAPANSARLAGPPLLSWTPVRGATYYNVQLFRDGKTKVLSVWPTEAQLQLKRSWRYHGRLYRLKPGRYRWFVWPGFGKRRAARYGHRIGSWTFVVAR